MDDTTVKTVLLTISNGAVLSAEVQLNYHCVIHDVQPSVEIWDYLPGMGREMGYIPGCSACEIEDLKNRLTRIENLVTAGGSKFTVCQGDRKWPEVLDLLDQIKEKA